VRVGDTIRARSARFRSEAVLAILIVSLVVGLTRPATALGAHFWTIDASTASVTASVATAVDVIITNTSTNDGGGDSIACVEITIPDAYVVVDVSIDPSGVGSNWSSSTAAAGASTLVTLDASDDNERLEGDPDFMELHATITVEGTTEGQADWTAIDYEHAGCSNVQGPTATIPMTVVTAANAPPAGTGDSYAVVAGNGMSVPAPGVLGNDTDPEDDSLTAVLVSDVSHGSLNLSPDGRFTYTPTAGFSGTDSFTYGAADAGGQSAPATVSINVTNTSPAAVDDAYVGLKNGTLTVPGSSGVLSNDSDTDPGQSLSAVLATNPASGTLTLGANGGFTYVPASSFVGAVSFTYRASDGVTTSAIATATITISNHAPVAHSDSYAPTMSLPLFVAAPGVLVNDDDPNGDPITAAVVTGPSHGTLSLAANGGFVYQPHLLYLGSDSFTYRVFDGSLWSDPVTVTLGVFNTTPVSSNDSATTLHDTGTGGNVLGNDMDANGHTLTAILVGDVGSGTLSLASDGLWTYEPNPGFVGTDSFTYRATDGAATSALATVTITVRNTDPIAADDAYSVHHADVLSVPAPGVLADDSDADDDPISPSLVDDVAHGSLVFGTDGGFAYDPDPGFTGDDSFSYTVTDGIATSALATVTITVRNTDPIAADDAYSVHHDRTLVVAVPGLLVNDDDADSDPLSAAVAVGPLHGTLVLSAAGRVVYTPDPSFVGIDSFTYTAADGASSSAATVTIAVTNAAPVGRPDAYSTGFGEKLSVPRVAGVLANDDDADGDAILAELADNPTNGTVKLLGTGAFTYIPDTGFVGTDTFRYAVADGITSSATTTVRVTVLPPPPDPEPTPSPEPSPEPSPGPTAEPSAEPTAEPSPDSSGEPGAEPSADPSSEPSAAPSARPGSGGPSTPPAPGNPGEPTVETWSVGGDAGAAGAADMPVANLAASTLGFIGRAFDWLVPGAMLTVPGLLLMLAIAAQAFGALAWLPLVRRKIGDFGLGQERSPAVPGRRA
jgi:VCBS repeat-containing protein